MTKYKWSVIYNNGDKYNEDKIRYTEINRDSLSIFCLENGVNSYFIPIEKNENLLYRKRVKTNFSESEDTITCHIIGILSQESNKILFIFEDGRTFLTSGFDDTSSWFYAPKIRPEEC